MKSLTFHFPSCYLDFLKSQCSAAFHFEFSPVVFSACLTWYFSEDLAQANLQSNWKLRRLSSTKLEKNATSSAAGQDRAREVLTHKIQFMPLGEYFWNQKMLKIVFLHFPFSRLTWKGNSKHGTAQGHYKALAYICIRNRRKKIKRKY